MNIAYETVADGEYVHGGSTAVPVTVYFVADEESGGDEISLTDGDGGSNVITHYYTTDSTVVSLPFGVRFSTGCFNATGDTVTVGYQTVV